MSLSRKGMQISDMKLNTSRTLNPNAAEFVPFALRSPSVSGSNSRGDVSAKFATSGSFDKAVLDRSESSVSNISDDEAHQFWRSQLPDDITPDFKVMNEDDSQGVGSLLSGLSLIDHSEASRVAPTRLSSSLSNGYAFSGQQELSSPRINGNSFADKIRHPTSSYSQDPSFASSLRLSAKPWDNQLVNGDKHFGNGKEGNHFDGSRNGTMNGMLGDHTLRENTDMNALDFLASQFPKFSLESIEEAYFSNAGNIRLTMQVLAQLELQGDGCFTQNLNSKALSGTNYNALDFQSLPIPDRQTGPPKYIGDDLQQSANPYQSSVNGHTIRLKRSSSLPYTAPMNYSSAVKKLPPQDSGLWNGSSNSIIGPSRSAHLLADSYSPGHGRGMLQPRSSTRTAETTHSELREDVRNRSQLHNAYLDQALIRNKVIAKELRLKAAHGISQEPVYHQRNPMGPERMIDLHGLPVNEAISVLKHELSVLRSTARAADRGLQVFVFVGVGLNTRLPVAVQRYLLEEEGLDYVEPQPGLLRVVIY